VVLFFSRGHRTGNEAVGASFHLDVRCLDNWRSLLDLRLVKRSKGSGRLVVKRRNLEPEIAQALADALAIMSLACLWAQFHGIGRLVELPRFRNRAGESPRARAKARLKANSDL